MALIKCKNCGQMVSDRSEKCLKCGYSVRLSVEQEKEEIKQPVKNRSTAVIEKKEVIKDDFQSQPKSRKKGIIIAVGVIAIIICGILFSTLNSGSNLSDEQQGTNQKSIFDKVIVSERGIDILNEAGILDNINGKIIESGTKFRDILVYCYQTTCYPMSKDFIAKAKSDYGFYNRVEFKMASLSDFMPYILLYNDNELMIALEPSSPYYSVDMYNSEVSTIIVYSDKLKMSNGIHTGLSAKEMVETYNAKIRYESGPEIDFLSFEIDGFPSNIKLMGSFDKVNSHLEGDYEYLKLEDVKNGKLDAIIICP